MSLHLPEYQQPIGARIINFWQAYPLRKKTLEMAVAKEEELGKLVQSRETYTLKVFCEREGVRSKINSF